MKRTLIALTVCVAACATATPVVDVDVVDSDITQNTTWRGAVTVDGDIYVGSASRPTLTVEAGTTVKFTAGSSLSIGRDSANPGALVVAGTASNKVTFTSTQTVTAPGDWQGLFFYESNDRARTRLEHLVVIGAGESSNTGAITADQTTIDLRNVTVEGSKGYGIDLKADARFSETSTGVVVKDAGAYAVRIEANFADSVPVDGSDYSDNVRPGVELQAIAVDRTQTWRNIGAPYTISGDLFIEGTASPVLTIAPGVTVQAVNSASISVGFAAAGGLYAVGTEAERITFTSASNLKDNGDWQGLYFYGAALDGESRLEHVFVESGGDVDSVGAVNLEQASITMVDVTVRGSKGAGVYLVGADSRFGPDSARLTVTGNEGAGVKIDDGNAVVSLPGGDSSYVGNLGFGVLLTSGAVVSRDATWPVIDAPYTMDGDLYVQGGSAATAVLTLNAGTTLAFAPGGELAVGFDGSGAVRAIGTAQSKVLFTSSQQTPSNGAWVGVHFYGGTIGGTNVERGSRLEHVEIRYAGSNSTASLIIDEQLDTPAFVATSVLNTQIGVCIQGGLVNTVAGLTATSCTN